MMPCSGEAGGTFASRLSSRSASRRASSGSPASSIRFRSCPRSPFSSSSPSSLADRPELLAEEVLALRLRHPLARLGRDLLAQLADRQLVLEQLHQPLHLGVQHVLFQQLLARRPRQRDRRSDEVRELSRVFERLDGADQLVRQLLHQRHQPTEQVDQRPPQPLRLDAGRDRLRRHDHPRPQVRVGLLELAELDPLQPLDHQPDRPVRAAHQLVDHARRADLVEVFRPGLLLGIRGLRHQRHQPIAAHHVVDQLDRALLAHQQRHHGQREDDRPAPERQHRQDLRDRRAGRGLALGRAVGGGALSRFGLLPATLAAGEQRQAGRRRVGVQPSSLRRPPVASGGGGRGRRPAGSHPWQAPSRRPACGSGVVEPASPPWSARCWRRPRGSRVRRQVWICVV